MNIRKLIGDKLSTVSNKVYYQYFPSTFNNEKDTGIIFTILGTENLNSFDGKEISKTYPIDIIIRSNSLDQINALIPNIKQSIYSVEGDQIKFVSLITDQSEYNEDLKVYEQLFQFDLKS